MEKRFISTTGRIVVIPRESVPHAEMIKLNKESGELKIHTHPGAKALYFSGQLVRGIPEVSIVPITLSRVQCF